MAHAWTSQSLCESQLGRRTTAHLYGGDLTQFWTKKSSSEPKSFEGMQAFD